MIALLERAFGIDQHVGDVLDVAHLPLAASHFEKRIVGGALRVGRIEQQHAPEPRAPTCGQRPVLTLDVMDDRRAGPGQESRNDQAHALAAARRRETQDMLGTVMAQVVSTPAAEEDAIVAKKAGTRESLGSRPSAPTRRS